MSKNTVTVGEYQYQVSIQNPKIGDHAIQRGTPESFLHVADCSCKAAGCYSITATNNPELNKQGVPKISENEPYYSEMDERYKNLHSELNSIYDKYGSKDFFFAVLKMQDNKPVTAYKFKNHL